MRLLIIIIAVWISVGESKSSDPRLSFKFPKTRRRTSVLRVIGGNVVSPANLYPFQAGLIISDSTGSSFCGGSLLTPEWVLTAAHCVSSNPRSITVLLGMYNFSDTLETNRQTYLATRYTIHPNWNEKKLINDIALVKLPQNATLNEYVGVTELSSASDTYTGRKGTIIGWGTTENEDMSSLLKQVVVGIMSNADCRAVNSNYDGIITDTHLCTSGEGVKGSCTGDSGGPLIVDGVQIGIVSFGYTECTLTYPSVFTRIPKYINWIEKTIAHGTASRFCVNIISLCVFSVILLLN